MPEYEPMLKAGGHWNGKLTVPEEIREAAGGPQSRQGMDGDPRSFTWIIEVASQVIFSTTASVHFEVLVGRDEVSVELGFHAGAMTGQGAPGRLEDHQQGRSRNAAQPKGVYSKAVRLAVDDTESLWNTPPFPRWDDDGNAVMEEGPHYGDKQNAEAKDDKKQRKQKKIHLVVLTHGLHSNLGADFLFMKESIDSAAKQAREDSKKRRAELRNAKIRKETLARPEAEGDKVRSSSTPEVAVAPTAPLSEEEAEADEEQVIVRGFTGNAVKTERGIQYLGKRLAKWVLSITYPDQPYLPVKSSISKSISRSLTISKSADADGTPTHKHSSIKKDEQHQNHNLAYKITSISFISHSLGGNIQTYAIAYIQKHSPEFFDLIKPINFVAMASPFLGLSNENPMYVKFALDFGLVGRTGQDLGLTWRPPTVVRSGWGAMIGGLSGEQQKQTKEPNPAAKPLLRVLPTGPAHVALKKFRNRSVYSNVVNDGIVPLRTSCLLFLDWRGLGRVEKARRENGLVGTMVGWGWNEMMGQNVSSPRRTKPWDNMFGDSGDDSDTHSRTGDPSHDHREEVPQPDEDGEVQGEGVRAAEKNGSIDRRPFQDEVYDRKNSKESSSAQPASPWAALVSFFKPQASGKVHHHPVKHRKIYERGQIRNDSPDTYGESSTTGDNVSQKAGSSTGKKPLVRGSSLYTNNSANEELEAPPKTTFFESAGDLLNPPLPPVEFLIDPEARPRTIFHDRVYHPEDIPPPPAKHKRSLTKRAASKESNELPPISPGSDTPNTFGPSNEVDLGSMKIEEKIARAYHKDLSWRKVLVRLEPDAHNNMIVRRMFANAYGWPVVKHVCDTHFAYTTATETPDSEESNVDRAKSGNEAAGMDGEEVRGQTDLPTEPRSQKETLQRARSLSPNQDNEADDELPDKMPKLKLEPPTRTDSEMREAADEVNEIVSPATAALSSSYSSKMSGRPPSRGVSRSDSARWSDRFFEGSEDDSDDDEIVKTVRMKKDADYGTHRDSTSPKVAAKLIESPKQSTMNLPMTAEPQPLRVEHSKPEDGIPDPSIMALTGVGLNTDVEEQVRRTPPDGKRGKGGGLGVAEQVAFARAKKSGSGTSTSVETAERDFAR